MNWSSPIITSLSLSILLKAIHPIFLFVAGLLACSSKHYLKTKRSGHFFNPANLGIVALLVAFPNSVWVSLNSWGTNWNLTLLFTLLGTLMLLGVKKKAQPLGFIFVYLTLLFSRAIWLGDPMAIPFHHLSSGALWLFVFFMISDPKTSPWNQKAAYFQGGLIAVLSFYP